MDRTRTICDSAAGQRNDSVLPRWELVHRDGLKKQEAQVWLGWPNPKGTVIELRSYGERRSRTEIRPRIVRGLIRPLASPATHAPDKHGVASHRKATARRSSQPHAPAIAPGFSF